MKTIIITILASALVIGLPIGIYHARKRKVGTRFYGEENREEEEDNFKPKNRY